MPETCEEKTITENNISRNEIPVIMFEFIDTLLKIKKISSVVKVCVSAMSDIYVITENDDIDVNEKIMKIFAQWETNYRIFPELHIINESEQFYIPSGANCI